MSSTRRPRCPPCEKKKKEKKSTCPAILILQKLLKEKLFYVEDRSCEQRPGQAQVRGLRDRSTAIVTDCLMPPRPLILLLGAAAACSLSAAPQLMLLLLSASTSNSSMRLGATSCSPPVSGVELAAGLSARAPHTWWRLTPAPATPVWLPPPLPPPPPSSLLLLLVVDAASEYSAAAATTVEDVALAATVVLAAAAEPLPPPYQLRCRCGCPERSWTADRRRRHRRCHHLHRECSPRGAGKESCSLDFGGGDPAPHRAAARQVLLARATAVANADAGGETEEAVLR